MQKKIETKINEKTGHWEEIKLRFWFAFVISLLLGASSERGGTVTTTTTHKRAI